MKKTTDQTTNVSPIIQPYIFVLKEGEKISENYLDYQLLLLQVDQINILPSPKSSARFSMPFIRMYK